MTEREMAAAYPGRGFAGTPRVPADTERLDWLERRGEEVLQVLSPDLDNPWVRWIVYFRAGRPDRLSECAPTLRDAIDAGMRITGDIAPPAAAGPDRGD